MYVYVYGMATTKHELLPHKYHSNYTICDTNIEWWTVVEMIGTADSC